VWSTPTRTVLGVPALESQIVENAALIEVSEQQVMRNVDQRSLMPLPSS